MILIPMTVLAVNSTIKSVDLMQQILKDSGDNVVSQAKDSIDMYMAGLEQGLNILSSNQDVELSLTDSKRYDSMINDFKTFIKNYPDVSYVYFGTTDTKFHAYPDLALPEGYNPTERGWYKEAVSKNTLIWTDPYIDAFTGKLCITAAIPVYSSDGSHQLLGVAGFDILLDSLSGFMGKVKVGNMGYATLIDNVGNVMTHKDKELIGKPVAVKELADAISQNKNGSVTYLVNENGKIEGNVSVFTTLDRIGWRIVANIYLNEVQGELFTLIRYNVIIGLITLVLAIIVSIWLANSVAKPISILSKNMESVKNGDFTVRSNIKTKDEVGVLANSFNIMSEGLKGLVVQVGQVSKDVSIASEALASTTEENAASVAEVARTVDEIAKGASEQASEAEKAAVLVGSMSDKFIKLGESSNEMLELSKEVSVVNNNGIKVVELLKERTRTNNTATERIVSSVEELANESRNIDGILDTISSIADQTNLLALNAAIEAARAGEAGRGFAVVADEIRKLAEQSGRSANEIKDIVMRIQNQSDSTVSVVGEVKERNKEQVQAVDDVNKAFDEISKSIDAIGIKIKDISNSVFEVSKDSKNTVAAIENISAVSEETAAASQQVSASMQQQTDSIEEVSRSADKLYELSTKLSSELDRFKV